MNKQILILDDYLIYYFCKQETRYPIQQIINTKLNEPNAKQTSTILIQLHAHKPTYVVACVYNVQMNTEMSSCSTLIKQ